MASATSCCVFLSLFFLGRSKLLSCPWNRQTSNAIIAINRHGSDVRVQMPERVRVVGCTDHLPSLCLPVAVEDKQERRMPTSGCISLLPQRVPSECDCARRLFCIHPLSRSSLAARALSAAHWPCLVEGLVRTCRISP